MPDHRIRLCLVLHNHQPIGNFDEVIEQAFQDSYRPFLDLFESYASLKIGLHTSGPLMLWLHKHHPEYLNRIRSLVAESRIEIIGGAFYEPILTMISSPDRQGQIRRFNDWLSRRFDTTVRGMWVPERVWEPGLVSDIASAGVDYTILDDFHFRCAGLGDDDLHGHYVTEDQGQTLRVFPGSEQLRYTIPFRDPAETIQHLREIADIRDNATVVFADDGEKFGTWPETKQHVYDDGWLRSFFDALMENRDWIHCTTLAEASSRSLPAGKLYLPAASYREMTEWSLPVERQHEYESITHEMQSDWRWSGIRKFIRGGFWRNFKCKYPETAEMYARMMHVSQRLDSADDGIDASLLEKARDHLYRGQCNCAYWHGAFGGVYLPHLRNAIYKNLILADNLIDQASGVTTTGSIDAADFNFDLFAEVRMANPELIGWIRPAVGGHLYELDVRSIGHNLLATMDRRPESYHDKIRSGANVDHDSASSIHDQVKFKQPDLDLKLIYDSTPCKSLVDHFWSPEVTAADVASGTARELGDFATGVFESTVRRSAERNQTLMTRHGSVDGVSVRVTKGVTQEATGSKLLIAYMLENLPEDCDWRFSVEFNFAGMPSGQDDRYFSDANGNRLGELGRSLDVADGAQITLSDEWLGLDVTLGWDQPGTIWTFPVETVNGSEGGFELVHQSVKVLPGWRVQGDSSGRWVVKLELDIQTRNTVEPNPKTPMTASLITD